MCIKAVDNYPSTIKYVPDWYKTQEICIRAVDDNPSTIKYVPDWIKIQEMCNKIISKNSFGLKYCPDKYITRKKFDEAVDNFLPTLNFVPDWFVTTKIIKKLFTALYADENILHFDEDFGNVAFNCNEMGILNIDLNCINLDDNNNFDEDPDTIIHVKLLAWHTKFEERKALKDISNEFVPVAWHCKRWWDWCMSDDKKEINPMFIKEL